MKTRLAALVCFVALAAFAADELQQSVGWTYNKNGRKRTLAAVTEKYDIAGGGIIENVQTIATNGPGELLTLGDVATPGWSYFKNLDGTNYVEIGCWDAHSNLVVFLKLNAGEAMPAWLGCAAPRARANTKTVKLDYVISDR
jgi:hypothetical protein